MPADDENAKPLPKTLPGAVCPQFKKCGRPNCHCQRGQLHGPYFYRFWRQAGRLRKQYVPRQQIADIQALCEARRQQQRETRLWLELAGILLRQSKEVEPR